MSISEAPAPVVAEPAADRWWTVAPLVMLADGGRIRLLSPNAATRLAVPADVAQLLLIAQNGVPREPASMLGWSASKYLSVTRLLSSHGYLVGRPEPDGLAPPWDDWGVLAWAYHDDLTKPSAATSAVTGPKAAEERPSSFRALHRDRMLLLPRLSPRGDKRFIDVLEQRRTHRDFHPVKISVEAFSDILRYTFGPLRFADGGPLGVLHLRAAASGGARHETEAYVYVFEVDGVAPGLYAYDSLVHGLAPIRSGELRAEVERLTLDQGFYREAAFGVITVAQSDRMSWKYRNGSAYRVIWQNTGHMAQVFSMMCASLDLGASMTGAIRVPEARACLALEAAADIVTFALACGHPRLSDGGLPVATRTPDAPFRL